MTKTATRFALWLAVAFVAVATATALIVGTAGNRTKVLSQDDIAGQLSSSTDDAVPTGTPGGTPGTPGAGPATGGPTTGSPATGSPTTASAATGPAAPAAVVRQVGPGTVTARCTDRGPELLTWSPDLGYRASGTTRDVNPATGRWTTVTVLFESDSADDVLVTMRCENGQPVVIHAAEPDDHGGDDKDDDGSGKDDDGSGKGDSGKG